MKLKHKVIKEFQFLSPDKKIFILKVGTILEEYNYVIKSELIPIDKDIIDGNPDFFEIIDWKAELLTYIKSNKLPQPSVLSKKLIPFFEDMLLSSMNQGISLDSDKIKDIEQRELELDRKESRLSDKDFDIEQRNKRIQNREDSYKDDLALLDRNENSLRLKLSQVNSKESEIESKERELELRERNLENEILKSSESLDEKYVSLQNKIDNDIKNIKQGVLDIEKRDKELSDLQSSLEQRESEVSDRERDLKNSIEDHQSWCDELRKLENEIINWEKLHWKFQRIQKPPSAL